MLSIAKQKVAGKSVTFIIADVMEDWGFTNEFYDLVVCSLVLEHIENIEIIIKRIARHLKMGGILYIGELYPFKQYTGSMAKFKTEKGEQIVTAFTHHITDFTEAVTANGLKIEEIKEYFDDDERINLPNILTLKFIKQASI